MERKSNYSQLNLYSSRHCTTGIQSGVTSVGAKRSANGDMVSEKTNGVHEGAPEPLAPAPKRAKLENGVANDAPVKGQVMEESGSTAGVTAHSIPPLVVEPLEMFTYSPGELLPVLSGHEGEVFEVQVPARYITISNEKLNTGQLWGTDMYTDDSDLVAVAVHMGFVQPTQVPPEADLSLQVKVGGQCDAYHASNRHNLQSREWLQGHDAYSVTIESVCWLTPDVLQQRKNKSTAASANGAVTTAVSNGTQPTNGTGASNGSTSSRRNHRTSRPPTSSSALSLPASLKDSAALAPLTTTTSSSSHNASPSPFLVSPSATSECELLPNVSVSFGFSNEPCLKYTLNLVADRGTSVAAYTSFRLKHEVLFLESASARYELSRIPGSGTAHLESSATVLHSLAEAQQSHHHQQQQQQQRNSSSSTVSSSASPIPIPTTPSSTVPHTPPEMVALLVDGSLDFDKYRFARVDDALKNAPRRALAATSLPLAPQHVTIEHTDMDWAELVWSRESVRMRSTTYPLKRMFWVPISQTE